MDLGIKGKNALIMASSQGLGKAVALRLAQEGANVLICGRNQDSLLATAEEIKSVSTHKVAVAVGDVSIADGREIILDTARKQLGDISILVTNSGGPPPGGFESHKTEAWEGAYRLLLESTVEMIRAVIPDMKTANWGRIITISSSAVKQPVDGLILSNAVRSSIVGLVKSLSNEYGPHGITVNNVMPGYTQTQRLEKLMEAHPEMASIGETIPLRRVGQPEEFAAAVAFLASERASYITGVSLPVDGGAIKSV